MQHNRKSKDYLFSLEILISSIQDVKLLTHAFTFDPDVAGSVFVLRKMIVTNLHRESFFILSEKKLLIMTQPVKNRSFQTNKNHILILGN